LAEYNLYRRDFSPNQFKILYVDKHNVPAGIILISDHIERNREEQIKVALTKTPSFISSSAGYLPNEKLPDYSYMIKVIERVKTVLKESSMVPQ
jgi:phosphonate transport system substrate-binding protein